MTKLALLVGLCLVFGTACNWWPEYYNDAMGRAWHRASWNGSNVEFGRCLIKPGGGWYFCEVQQSQIKSDGCLHAEPTDWCVGQPPPSGVDAMYVVNY